MSNQNLVEKMQEISESLNSVTDMIVEFNKTVTGLNKSETDRFAKKVYDNLEKSSWVLVNQLKSKMKTELNYFSGILKYGKLFNELREVMLNLSRFNDDGSKNIQISTNYLSCNSQVTLLLNKKDRNVGTACFSITVDTMTNSIKFGLSTNCKDWSISTTFGELNFKNNKLVYADNYDSKFNEWLKSHINDDPEQFIKNLINEFESMDDNKILFPEFNNDDPLLQYDDTHTVNSVILSLMRVTRGYSRIYSLESIKNNEFNYESNGDLVDGFNSWTERFFIEKDGEEQGYIGADLGHRGSTLLRIADQCAIGFNSPSLQLYLIEPCENSEEDDYCGEDNFDYDRLMAIKSCFFARDYGKNDAEWTHEEILMDLDESIESELNSIDLKKFMNKYMELLSYANYFENWNEIIEKAFDVENKIKGEDHIKNFVSMINHFINYDLSI